MRKPVPFGKYLLLERVNVGGMAEVFKAKAFGVEGFERMVAVKRILPNIAEDAEFIAMFVDEAKISVQLNHANIAQVFDLGKHGDSYYIALEYVAGRDLRALFDRARTRGEPLPIPFSCYAAMKMCEGLDYAHNKRDAGGRDLQLIHRDVSPQNVLVSYDGEVKIIDFGIAKAANKASQTQAGIVKGKFGYMSPEQVQGLPIDRRSDVFAVGIVLYELLTTERLFVGESDFSTIEKIRNASVTPPTRFNARIPAELERIVLKALAKDLDQRYQTAMDLHDDLQAFMYSSGSFFARKDLSAFMRRAFAEEIAKETARDEIYRKLDLQEVDVGAEVVEQPRKAGGKSVDKPPQEPPKGPLAPPPAPRASAPEPPKSAGSALEWDDDELATRVYDKGDMDSLPPPAALPAPKAPAAPAGPKPAVAVMGSKAIGVGAPPPPAARTTSPGGLAAPPAPRVSSPGALAAPPPPRPAPAPTPGNPPRSVSLAPPSAPAPRAGAPSPFGGGAPAPAPVPPTPAVPSTPPPTAHPTEIPPRGHERTTMVMERTSGFGGSTALLGGGLALLATLLGVAWYFLRPKDPGTLQFATVPADVVVVFDGQAVQASSSPFSINVDPDSPHLLEVNKVGYRTYSTRVTLRPGEQRTLPTIELQSQGGGEVGTRNVVVAFASEPTGADVILVRGRDRLVLGRAPVNATVNVAGEAWTVEMSLDGYETWRGGLNVPDGQSSIAMPVVLRQRAAAEVRTPPPSTNTPSAMTEPSPPPTTNNTPPPPTMVASMEASMTTATESSGTGPGTLRVNSTPWSQVFVDGRLIGNTPQMNIQLAPGLHRLTLVNPDFNIRENQTVMIEPGSTVTRVVRLQAPSPAPAP